MVERATRAIVSAPRFHITAEAPMRKRVLVSAQAVGRGEPPSLFLMSSPLPPVDPTPTRRMDSSYSRIPGSEWLLMPGLSEFRSLGLDPFFWKRAALATHRLGP